MHHYNLTAPIALPLKRKNYNRRTMKQSIYRSLSKLTCVHAYQTTEKIKMSDQQDEKLFKLLEGREKAKSKIKGIYQQTNETVEKINRHVRVERLVTSCKKAMTKAIKNFDQIRALTTEDNDSFSLLKEEESWLNVLTKTIDEELKRARQYFDSRPATDKASQSSSKTTETSLSIRSGNSATSKTSCQRQKKLLIAKHCREGCEYQHEDALLLAKQKQEIEL